MARAGRRARLRRPARARPRDRRALGRRPAAAPGPRAADALRENFRRLPGRLDRDRRRRRRSSRLGRVVPGQRPAVVRARRDDDRAARDRRPARPGRPLPTVAVESTARATIRTGSVAIAAITSCTNTSNPTVMVGAGLLARNAVARGLTRRRRPSRPRSRPGSQGGHRRTSRRPGLMAPLETLGFALAGYGCTTCIGNSGPLDEPIAAGDRGERPRRRGRPVGQPQLRGPDPSARARELPRLAAARRRVRARRPGRHRPHDRAAGHRRRTASRSSSPTSGRRPRRSAPVIARLDRPRALPADLRRRVRGRRPLAGAADPGRATATTGTRPRPTSRKPPFFDGLTLEPAAARRHRGRPRARGPRRLGHDRPHLPRRLDRALVARRPVAPGARRRARSSSTRTAPGAATTR